MQLFRSSILSSEPILVGQRWLVIRSHAVQITLPFVPAALVWNRPFAVQVKNEDGTDQNLPVIDITRIAQISLLVLGLLFAVSIGRKAK